MIWILEIGRGLACFNTLESLLFPLFPYYLFLSLLRLLFNALSLRLVSYLSSYKHRLARNDTLVKLVSRILYTVLMVLVFIPRGMKADFMREYYDFWPLDNSNRRMKVGWQSDLRRNFQTILTNLRIIINSSACFLFAQMSTIIIQIHTQCINNPIRCYHRILIAVLLLIRSGTDAWEYKYLHIHKTMINIYDHVIRFYLLAIIISYNKYWF